MNDVCNRVLMEESDFRLPLVTITSAEIGKIVKQAKRPIQTFPAFLGTENGVLTFDPTKKKDEYDAESGTKVRIPIIPILEKEGIKYMVKDLHLADYRIVNKSTGNKTMIKRMTVDELLNFMERFDKKQTIQMFKDFKNAYGQSINLEFIIEGYNMILFDTTENCLRVPWRYTPLDKGKSGKAPKLDKAGHAIYAWFTTRKVAVRPNVFTGLISKVRALGIRVIPTFDAKGVYEHLLTRIFGREDVYDEDGKLDRRMAILLSYFPEMPDDTIKKLINTYKSVINVLNSIVKADSFDQMRVNIDPYLFDEIKRDLTLNFTVES